MVKAVLSSEELCNIFLNGFINGYIPQSKITSNIEDVGIIDNNAELKIATWKLGLITGNEAQEHRRN